VFLKIRISLLLFVFYLVSCIEKEADDGDLETYWVEYTVDYVNTADFDIELTGGTFSNKVIDSLWLYTDSQRTLEKNSEGTFSVDWIYTWPSFVREPWLQERGDFISSFNLRLDINSNTYIIAGWPESVYRLDNIISYGHGWGYGVSSIGVIQDGELTAIVFDDFPLISRQVIKAKATLQINSADDIVFRLTEFPHTIR
jgi:hypothetical protein